MKEEVDVVASYDGIVRTLCGSLITLVHSRDCSEWWKNISMFHAQLINAQMYMEMFEGHLLKPSDIVDDTP